MSTDFENILIEYPKAGMISYLNTHPEKFEEAIQLAIVNKQPYSWRAASLLWSCMEENDRRIRKYIDDIINSLPAKEDGHLRELLRILLKMKLNKKQEGMLFDLCLTHWENIHHRPSVRYIAFLFITKIVKKYPDLADEVLFLTQEHYVNTLSPGIKNAVFRLIKELKN